MTMRRPTVLLTVAGAAGAIAAGWLALRPAAPPAPVTTGPAASVQPADDAGPPAPGGAPQAADDAAANTQADAGAARPKRPEPRRPEAARAERPRSLLPLVQPLWSELTPTQQFVLAPFEDQWNTWPQAEKRAWVSLADRVPRMSAEQQAKAHARIHEWAALSPEARRLARQNYRLAKQLPPDARVAQWHQYETLTDEQKDVLRSAGSTSNTAARHAGARTALAKEAPKPIVPPAR